MKQKTFKSLDEQVAILKSRGLRIPDENFAKEFLYKNNYYRVSGYFATLCINDVFHENTTFKYIVDIYNFDYELRHILSKYLEIIEVKLKSVYAYEFEKIYGATGYLNSKNFTDSVKHKNIITKIQEQINKSLPHELYLQHFERLKIDVPLWAVVDVMTISDISILFSISNAQIQNKVATYILSTHFSSRISKHFANFMRKMTIIRNLCAHGSRFYNRMFLQKPKLTNKELSILLTKPDGTKDNEHLFSFILIMKRLLCCDDFKKFKQEMISLKNKIPYVDLVYYGFPENWQNIL